jgi:hypothetical protein
VNASDCSKCSGLNELYTSKGTSCLDTCDKSETPCASEPSKPLCHCTYGYHRLPETGQCSSCSDSD